MKYAAVNGIRLHYKEAGKGKLMLFLHGFPDSSDTWKHQIKYFSKKYHTIAPDLRGYNKSDKPKGVSNYSLDVLMKDVKGLIDHFKGRKIILVGHDWGGLLSWYFTMNYPQYVKKLIILNIPHPSFVHDALHNFSQIHNSDYILFFQIPFLPEILFKLFWPLSKYIGHIPYYVDAFDKKRFFGPAINYYRAWVRSLVKGIKLKKINIPTLVLWGQKDAYIGKEYAIPPKKWVSKAKVKFFNTGHWVHQEKYKEVNKAINNFLKS